MSGIPLNAQEQLFDAIGRNDTAGAKTALKAGTQLETADKDGYLPLFYAIACHRREMVSFLIEQDADIEARNPDLGTPLLAALALEEYEIALDLLGNGADASAQDKQGASAFGLLITREASEADMDRLFQPLLKAGADPDAANRAGFKILRSAVDRRQARMTELLLDAGADPSPASSAAASHVWIYAQTGENWAMRIAAALGNAGVNIEEAIKTERQHPHGRKRMNALEERIIKHDSDNIKKGTARPLRLRTLKSWGPS